MIADAPDNPCEKPEKPVVIRKLPCPKLTERDWRFFFCRIDQAVVDKAVSRQLFRKEFMIR